MGQFTKSVLLVFGRATQVAHLNEPLIEAGYKVYSFDAPAHGKSNGRQTMAEQISEIEFRTFYWYLCIKA